MPGRAIWVAFVLAASLAAAPGRAAAPAHNYADPNTWLCRPGRADACSVPLSATVMSTDGALSKRDYPADPKAPIDCFYVYPTVSKQRTANADMTLGPEETEVVKVQFARFGAKCRLYAPLYRQVTLAVLRGKASGADTQLAYHDVLAAWLYYLDHDNQGRGVVLIGHSQGSKILVRLLAEEIDGKPIQARLVAAILPGAAIAVPAGAAVGASFKAVPLCDRAYQFGCVIGYSTYLAGLPVSADARFGADPAPGQRDACVNPAALLGHATLQPEFPVLGKLADIFQTTFIENPGLLTGECQRVADHDLLMISTGSAGPILRSRLSSLESGDPDWGLHVIDLNLALGDLVELVGRQSAAWSARNPRP
jgi:pimeloyl-ACP methyl ester carboxylesterase